MKIRALSEESHRGHPGWYPKPGTVGEVVEEDEVSYLVQWPAGSTSSDDKWWYSKHLASEIAEEQTTSESKIETVVPDALYRRLDWCLVNLMKGETVSIREAGQLHGWLRRLRREQSK